MQIIEFEFILYTNDLFVFDYSLDENKFEICSLTFSAAIY
jgi:hypothetical protein